VADTLRKVPPALAPAEKFGILQARILGARRAAAPKRLRLGPARQLSSAAVPGWIGARRSGCLFGWGRIDPSRLRRSRRL